MKHTLRNLLLASLVVVTTNANAEDKIDYPDGYRMWTHVKTMTLHKGHALENPFLGIHHIYANLEAVEGIKSGRFNNGAVLVFDQFKYITKDKASTEGDRVLVGVMVKDSDKYPSTGGWGFEGFAGDSRTQRLVSDGGTSCFACHTSQKSHDYVFARWRD